MSRCLRTPNSKAVDSRNRQSLEFTTAHVTWHESHMREGKREREIESSSVDRRRSDLPARPPACLPACACSARAWAAAPAGLASRVAAGRFWLCKCRPVQQQFCHGSTNQTIQIPCHRHQGSDISGLYTVTELPSPADPVLIHGLLILGFDPLLIAHSRLTAVAAPSAPSDVKKAVQYFVTL